MTTDAPLRLGSRDFEESFGETLSPYVRQRIERYDFRYRLPERSERDAWLQRIVRVLLQGAATPAGTHRQGEWAAGWGQNLGRFLENPGLDAMVPGYFGKYQLIRWKQDFIVPLNPLFERNSLAIIQDWLFDSYLRKAKTVYEFGCGTGHNLFRVRDVNPDATLYGLDWSETSQKLLGEVARSGLDGRMKGIHFNLFEPDPGFSLEPGACVVTVAALEQLGQRFIPFLEYILSQPVSLCIHIEPIAELLDPDNLLDDLSLAYFKLRNYLDGYLTRLRALEDEGALRILRAQRSYIGSLFIDGYSVIVWSPRPDRAYPERG